MLGLFAAWCMSNATLEVRLQPQSSSECPWARQRSPTCSLSRINKSVERLGARTTQKHDPPEENRYTPDLYPQHHPPPPPLSSPQTAQLLSVMGGGGGGGDRWVSGRATPLHLPSPSAWQGLNYSKWWSSPATKPFDPLLHPPPPHPNGSPMGGRAPPGRRWQRGTACLRKRRAGVTRGGGRTEACGAESDFLHQFS